MTDLLTLTEAELGSGISRDMWRKMARTRKVSSTRTSGLQQILIPITEVARIVVGGFVPKRGRPRLAQLAETEETLPCLVSESVQVRQAQRAKVEAWRRGVRRAPDKYLAPQPRTLWTATELYEEYLRFDPSTKLDLYGFTNLIRGWEVHCRQPILTQDGARRLYAKQPAPATTRR